MGIHHAIRDVKRRIRSRWQNYLNDSTTDAQAAFKKIKDCFHLIPAHPTSPKISQQEWDNEVSKAAEVMAWMGDVIMAQNMGRLALQPVADDSPGGDDMGSETTESSVFLSSSDEEMDVDGFGPTTMPEAKMFRGNVRKKGLRKTPTIRPRVPWTQYVTYQARADNKS